MCAPNFRPRFVASSQSMDMLLPDPRALEFGGDLGWLGKIRQAAKARYRDEALDIRDCGDKVRRLIEEAVIADGVQVLVKEVSLFGADFDEKVRALKSHEARASEMEHAIRHGSTSSWKKIPPTSSRCASVWNRSSPTARHDASTKPNSYRCCRVLIHDTRGHARAADDVGLSETGFAIYGLLRGAAAGLSREIRAGYDDTRVREVTAAIEDAVAPHVAIVDWNHKADVQREMRRQIRRRLPAEVLRQRRARGPGRRADRSLKARKAR